MRDGDTIGERMGGGGAIDGGVVRWPVCEKGRDIVLQRAVVLDLVKPVTDFFLFS